MRYGAISFIWASPFSTDRLDLVARVAGLGFDVLEVCVEQPGLLDPQALRGALDEHGLGAVVIGFNTPERDVSSPDDGVRRAGLDYLACCVDLAESAGATLVTGPLQAPVGRARILGSGERAAELARAAEGLREAADYAGEHGAALAIEPLNRFESDMLNTVEQGLDLCERIDRNNVGLLLDTFHMNIEERSHGDAIRSAGDRLFHFHASENTRRAAGSGSVVPWPEVRDALAGIRYDGAVSVESFGPELAELVSEWRPFFDDPDEFAGASLAHVKSVFG